VVANRTLIATPAADAASEGTSPPTEPIPANGTIDGVKVCKRCGAENAPTAGRCASCESWLARNQGARKTGIYAREQPPDLVMTADELEAGIVSDLGGVEGMSTLERSYVRKIRDLEITLRLLASDIARNNMLTPGGRVRDVYPAFLSGLATFDRYAQRVGLERRSRRVDLARALSGMR
jgi:ribosomal protein L40E